MRKPILDQCEFDSFSSEESLEIHVAVKELATVRQFSNLHTFVTASAGPDAIEKLGNPVPFNDWVGFSPVRADLARFAGIHVPDPCDWLVLVLFEDDLEWDGVFETPDMFIRYHWLSTA